MTEEQEKAIDKLHRLMSDALQARNLENNKKNRQQMIGRCLKEEAEADLTTEEKAIRAYVLNTEQDTL